MIKYLIEARVNNVIKGWVRAIEDGQIQLHKNKALVLQYDVQQDAQDFVDSPEFVAAAALRPNDVFSVGEYDLP